GNVRELANVVEAASTLWPADLETWSDVPAMVKRAEPDAVAPRGVTTPAGGSLAVQTLEDVERNAVAHALAVHRGNVAQAARALGVARATLYNLMARYQLRQPARSASSPTTPPQERVPIRDRQE
ncbi:MAG: hypothetical protein IT379_23020, partial [Deltaproteobacteria bacterium]|nr:hypothetical protein [Deltaproteobacteria bacterium]